MLAPAPQGCGRSGLSLQSHHPPVAISPDRQPSVRQRMGGEGAALGEKQVRSCWGWNEEAAEEKPARSQGSSRWEIATERRSGGHGQGSRLAASHPRACSQILWTPRLKEERKQEHWGGCDAGATGQTLAAHRAPSPHEIVPGIPSPCPAPPGMRDLAWDGDEGHEPGSPEPLRYQIRRPSSLLHAVLARPKRHELLSKWFCPSCVAARLLCG